MLHHTSRQIVAERSIEDRLAEVRRSHLLREGRSGQPAFRTGGAVYAGPSLLDRLADAMRHLGSPSFGHTAFS
jgi:hypothetical protein